jgi:hypothetical protein
MMQIFDIKAKGSDAIHEKFGTTVVGISTALFANASRTLLLR